MKSAQYWVGYFDAKKDASYDLVNLIVDIQNDAIHGVGSTPVNKKSSTPLKQKTAKEVPATLNPTLTYNCDGLYVANWTDQLEAFVAEPPRVNNYLSEDAESKVIGRLFALGFRATEPMMWVAQDLNRWVLVPRNEWKDDTTSDGPGLGVGYS